MDLYDSNLDKKHRKEDHDREEELKQLLAKDVNENFELVVLIYQHRLKAYAYCLLHHEQNAEDVLQEVFISAYRALLKRSPAQIKTLKLTPWLFTAVHHRCINQISRYEKWQAHLLSVDSPEGQFLCDEQEELQLPLPHIQVERNEAFDEMLGCINSLPKIFRDPVILHYISDLPFDEVGLILGRPLNTVKSQCRRGLKLLRERAKKIENMKEEEK